MAGKTVKVSPDESAVNGEETVRDVFDAIAFTGLETAPTSKRSPIWSSARNAVPVPITVLFVLLTDTVPEATKEPLP